MIENDRDEIIKMSLEVETLLVGWILLSGYESKTNPGYTNVVVPLTAISIAICRVIKKLVKEDGDLLDCSYHINRLIVQFLIQNVDKLSFIDIEKFSDKFPFEKETPCHQEEEAAPDQEPGQKP